MVRNFMRKNCTKSHFTQNKEPAQYSVPDKLRHSRNYRSSIMAVEILKRENLVHGRGSRGYLIPSNLQGGGAQVLLVESVAHGISRERLTKLKRFEWNSKSSKSVRNWYPVGKNVLGDSVCGIVANIKGKERLRHTRNGVF